jgi:hypothetical protein
MSSNFSRASRPGEGLRSGRSMAYRPLLTSLAASAGRGGGGGGPDGGAGAGAAAAACVWLELCGSGSRRWPLLPWVESDVSTTTVTGASGSAFPPILVML